MARLRPAAEGMRLQLEDEEVTVLASLADGLSERVARAAHGDDTDPVAWRLAPTVSRGDPEVDGELRAMLRGDLLSMRAERLTAFADDLRAWRSGERGALDHVLDRDGSMRMVEALNDLRLALATTIGFDEDLRQSLDVDDPRHDAVRLMDALAWLQGGLIEFVDGED